MLRVTFAAAVCLVVGLVWMSKLSAEPQDASTSEQPSDQSDDAPNADLGSKATPQNTRPESGTSKSSNAKSKAGDQVSGEPIQPNPRGKLKLGAFNKLDQFETWVLVHKGTERAFTGEYWDHKEDGTYVCRRCNSPLYKSSDKFDSECGWPSFDDELPKAVTRVPDKDGMRIEIVCTNCGGHLGHVFLGERFTKKDTRHCVNSVSIKFVPKDKPLPALIPSKDRRPNNDKNAKSLDSDSLDDSESAREEAK